MPIDFEDFLTALEDVPFDYDFSPEDLADPDFKQMIANNAYEVLMKAAEFGNAGGLTYLLTIPEVKNIITDNENEAFITTVSYGHLDAMNVLLLVPTVAQMARAMDKNELLEHAKGFDETIARLHEFFDEKNRAVTKP